jgi:phosphoadenosine phosphosulfate reductase
MANRRLEEWKRELNILSPEERIKWAIKEFGKNKVTLASSLGVEDQILTHMLLSLEKDVKVFVLDTGRMFQETYFTIEKTEKHYNFKYKIYFPDFRKVEKMVNNKGINLFYESVENRKLCCHIRKVLPLKRALKGFKCWICGLRREQSVTRQSIEVIEWDDANKLYKLNPIFDWSNEMVWSFVKQNNIPYNKLHDKGFPSIGCEPCTRAVKEGEDIRSGRWWWESPEHKECGLHRR